jgi:hypothetical protein
MRVPSVLLVNKVALSFTLGFFSIPLTLVLSILFVFNIIFSSVITKPKSYVVFYGFAFLLFVFSFYLIGWLNIIGESNHIRSAYVLLSIFVIILLSLKSKSEERVLLCHSFIFGMLLYSLGIVISSLIKGGYGYGLLYNPWIGTDINSPSVSNNLALIGAFYILFPFQGRNFLRLFLITIIVFSGIYVGGRTFLVVLSLCFLFVALSQRLKYILLILLVTVFTFLFLYFTGVFQIAFQRFYLMGFESARFLLFIDAYLNIPYYEFGGFSPQGDENVWYHNMFFDTARVSGWYPLFLLVFLSISSMIIPIIRNHKRVLVFQFSIFMIISQDVILESNLKPFILLIFIFFCSNNYLENRKL